MFIILPKVGRYRNMSTIVASCDDWRRQLFAARCFSCHVRLRDVDDVDHDGEDDRDEDDVGNDNDNGDGNCLFHAASLAMCVAVMVAMMTMMVMMMI